VAEDPFRPAAGPCTARLRVAQGTSGPSHRGRRAVSGRREPPEARVQSAVGRRDSAVRSGRRRGGVP
jgi:hypothetical protein